MSPDTVRAAMAAWMAQDPDPDTRAELAALAAADRWEELAARFGGRLAFGTAGLRAELGAGPMRMNRLVVRQSAAGIVAHQSERLGRPPRVVVGYDARHKSDVFAADTAAVVTAAGGEAHVFTSPGPTPLLAFAVRHLRADVGIMVTASHNPPADNGYKVYLGDGAQIVPPIDAEIAGAIDRVSRAPVQVAEGAAGAGAAVGADVVDAYLDAVVSQTVRPDARDVSVVYTPLHGVGGDLVRAAFARAGFPAPSVVAAQARPDPTFPTVGFPNPEEPGALDLGVAQARRCGADVLLANDPDADRLGVAVPDGEAPGGWRALGGNEIGALLADHLLRHRAGGADRLVVTTVVSSRLLSRLAEAHGVHYEETLTGFKWIVRPALAHPEWVFTFGYEEALGYSVGSAVWDKDGIGAALVFAEAVAAARAEGSGVHGRLEQLARAHGLHATEGWSLRFPSRDAGAAEAARVMGRLRSTTPAELAGATVTGRRDLAGGGALPPSDALIWDLSDGTRLVFRPSGTEPKLKVYAEVVRAVPRGVDGYRTARREAAGRLAELRQAVGGVITG